jgi:hypothetical protein
MYENKIFKRDACDEVSLLHPRHRFAKTRTRREATHSNIDEKTHNSTMTIIDGSLNKERKMENNSPQP